MSDPERKMIEDRALRKLADRDELSALRDAA